MRAGYFFILTATIILAVGGLPTFGHHSFQAEFSRDLPVDVTGTVTAVEWMNPHARFYIDVEDETGEVVNWNFELASPNGLMRRGWTRNSMKIGDVISVTGSRAKNDPHVANASRVTLASGERLFAGSSGGDPDDPVQ